MGIADSHYCGTGRYGCLAEGIFNGETDTVDRGDCGLPSNGCASLVCRKPEDY
jgi:hypothetical protein